MNLINLSFKKTLNVDITKYYNTHIMLEDIVHYKLLLHVD